MSNKFTLHETWHPKALDFGQWFPKVIMCSPHRILWGKTEQGEKESNQLNRCSVIWTLGMWFSKYRSGNPYSLGTTDLEKVNKVNGRIVYTSTLLSFLSYNYFKAAAVICFHWPQLLTIKEISASIFSQISSKTTNMFFFGFCSSALDSRQSFLFYETELHVIS